MIWCINCGLQQNVTLDPSLGTAPNSSSEPGKEQRESVGFCCQAQTALQGRGSAPCLAWLPKPETFLLPSSELEGSKAVFLAGGWLPKKSMSRGRSGTCALPACRQGSRAAQEHHTCALLLFLMWREFPPLWQGVIVDRKGYWEVCPSVALPGWVLDMVDAMLVSECCWHSVQIEKHWSVASKNV